MVQMGSGETGMPRRGEHLDEDGCLDLLHNLLTPAERDTILEHVAVCSSCENLPRERAAQYERLRARGIPGRASACRQSWDALTKSVMQVLRVPTAVLGVVRRRRFQVAGVAGAALVIMLSTWRSNRAPVMIASQLQLLETGIGDVRFRGSLDPASAEQLSAAVEAYGNLDFGAAVRILRRLEVPPDFEDFRKIYLGSSLAWMERYDEAARVLEHVDLETVPEPWSGEAHWTLYIALRESGDPVKAESLLAILKLYDGAVGVRARQVSPPTP